MRHKGNQAEFPRQSSVLRMPSTGVVIDLMLDVLDTKTPYDLERNQQLGQPVERVSGAAAVSATVETAKGTAQPAA